MFEMQEQILLRECFGDTSTDLSSSIPPGTHRDHQSERCQKHDWRKHRHDCSLLPIAREDATSSSILTCEELASEVNRITQLLKEWKDALDRDNNVDAKVLKMFKESKDLLGDCSFNA